MFTFSNAPAAAPGPLPPIVGDWYPKTRETMPVRNSKHRRGGTGGGTGCSTHRMSPKVSPNSGGAELQLA